MSPWFGAGSGLVSLFGGFWCLERLFGHALHGRLKVQNCGVWGNGIAGT